MGEFPEEKKTFRVRVGAAQGIVTCESERAAVEEIREQFRQQMPHLGTVIQGLSFSEFQVEQIA
jgi:hypothetical protein